MTTFQITLRSVIAGASTLAQFFSAAAFEQRKRDRERRRLTGELQAIASTRAHHAVRESMILKRSAELDRLGSEAVCAASRKAARRSPTVVELKPRLALAKGPVAMKLQAQEIYGRGPRLSTTEDRAAHMARVLIALIVFATLAAWVIW